MAGLTSGAGAKPRPFTSQEAVDARSKGGHEVENFAMMFPCDPLF